MNILMVDGDRPNAMLLVSRLYLQESEYRVDVVETLSEALSFGVSGYDIIITRMDLTDSIGTEPLDRLREEVGKRGIPVVVYMDIVDRDSVEDFIRRGASGVISAGVLEAPQLLDLQLRQIRAIAEKKRKNIREIKEDSERLLECYLPHPKKSTQLKRGKSSLISLLFPWGAGHYIL